MTETGFEECFREHFAGLVALGESMTGDCGVAHDIAQETFIRLHDRWDTVSGYERPGSWLRRVMSNLLIDHHRSRSAERRAVVRLANGDIGRGESDVFAADGWSQLVSALAPRQRLIVTLFYGYDQSVTDIAATLGLSANTVKSSLSKARTKLRAGMERRHAE